MFGHTKIPTLLLFVVIWAWPSGLFWPADSWTATVMMVSPCHLGISPPSIGRCSLEKSVASGYFLHRELAYKQQGCIFRVSNPSQFEMIVRNEAVCFIVDIQPPEALAKRDRCLSSGYLLILQFYIWSLGCAWLWSFNFRGLVGKNDTAVLGLISLRRPVTPAVPHRGPLLHFLFFFFFFNFKLPFQILNLKSEFVLPLSLSSFAGLSFFRSHWSSWWPFLRTTVTTVGYGDITPQNDDEKMFTMFSMIVGGAFYGSWGKMNDSAILRGC